MTKLIDLILHCPIDIRESATAYGMPLREILADTTHTENFCYTDVQARLVWAKEVVSASMANADLFVAVPKNEYQRLLGLCEETIRKHGEGRLGDPGDSVVIDKLSQSVQNLIKADLQEQGTAE